MGHNGTVPYLYHTGAYDNDDGSRAPHTPLCLHIAVVLPDFEIQVLCSGTPHPSHCPGALKLPALCHRAITHQIGETGSLGASTNLMAYDAWISASIPVN